MSRPRYLTESRFKLAKECPTKLYYASHKDVYPDANLDNPFLESLANGGFQIGELAKRYHPGGVDISTLDYEVALKQTNEALQNDHAIIYEAAIKYRNLFIRADILIKKDNTLKIVEVKAKSCEGNNPEQLLDTKGLVRSTWLPYLEDAAFQKHVVMNAFPKANVVTSLMLADKTLKASTDGLNAKFKVSENKQRRKCVEVNAELNGRDLASPILTEIPVDDILSQIYNGTATKSPPTESFADSISRYSAAYEQDKKISPILSKSCGSCEFRCDVGALSKKQRSGLNECWREATGLSNEALKKPLIIDLWYPKVEKYLEQGLYLLENLDEEAINLKSNNAPGMSRSERQWLQITKLKNKDDTETLHREGLQSEMESFTYPLHFIDFETSKAAITFNKNRRPYEQVAFQFSHHILEEDGRIRHAGEHINVEPGKFPNYDFVRALKQQLETDNGTIFRYHNHENTVLCDIHRQLTEDEQPEPDADQLLDFIESITHSTKDAAMSWQGERDMVDLQKLVVKYYYDPRTGGSNSIKYVLPALLSRSTFLQHKYEQPIYGTSQIPSNNFSDHTWLKRNNGNIVDPYKLLPPIFEGISTEEMDLISEADELKDGGAALTAYGMLQHTDMSPTERENITKALLRYCELDTMAMVMIYEAWKSIIYSKDMSNEHIH